MFQSLAPKSSFGLFAVSLFLLQFLLTWLAICSKQPAAAVGIDSVKLTKETLDDFTFYLTSGSTDPHSVRLPTGLTAEKFNGKSCIRYILGSVAVFGKVDRRALSVIHGLTKGRLDDLPDLFGELARKNDLDTVAHWIARNAGTFFWDISFGYLITEMVKDNWSIMHRLFERVLAILKESEDQSKQYRVMIRCMPIGLQYELINSGKVPFDEIDRIYLCDEPFYLLMREIFFRARCSSTPNLQIRKCISEKVPWFRQFMPDIPSKAKDTCVSSSVEPGHDVWTRIRNFTDVETLVFIWPLVCSTWNKSYSKILAEDRRIHECLLQDLSHVSWRKIHTIAPWNHFLNEDNSAVYLGQCIINGALGRAEPDDQLNRKVREYLYDVIRGYASIPKTGKWSVQYDYFVKLIEEGYKVYSRGMPTLFKPPFLTDEEYERVIHYLVCEKKLAVRLSYRWIIGNVSRIYSILGEDQVLMQRVIDLNADNLREVLFVWIMIGQACGMTKDTARLIFDKPGIFVEKFIRPVVVKPSEYYDFIADSGMLFEMLNIYYKDTAYERPGRRNCPMHELGYLIISLILYFKDKPAKIEKIVASMNNQLPTLHEQILQSMKRRFGIGTQNILAKHGKYPSEDVEFVKEVLMKCGLLDRIAT